MYRFNSRVNKTPFGAVKEGENVNIVFPVTRTIWIKQIDMILRRDSQQWIIPLTFDSDDGNTTNFTCNFSVPEWGIYYYRFEVQLEGGGMHYIGAGDEGDALSGSFLPEWQLTVYAKDYIVPNNMQGGIIYHIFVDRFCHEDEHILPKHGVLKPWGTPVTIVDADGVYRANDFYGGNFKGIISKLDYLKELGVTTIYLSPIFEASSNHRYDTGNYLKIDPLIGTEEDFANLIKEAKKRGMGIMLDGVFNHTGADSIYFNQLNHYNSVGAANSKCSPYYDWYYFIDYPHDYHSWWGVKVVPTLNKDNKDYRKLIFGKDGVIDKWTKFGLQGWRLDVVDELPMDFVDELYKAVKAANKEVLVIGEVWEDASIKVSYGTLRPYFTKGQLDGIMNYPFKEAIINVVLGGNPKKMAKAVMQIVENYPKDSLNSCMTLIDSHDTVRIINSMSGIDVHYMSKAERQQTKLSGDALEIAKKRVMMASLLQYVLPGVPSVYYGDEVGLQGYEDPLNRACFPWGKIDDELLSHYKFLGKLRKDYKSAMLDKIKFIEQGSLLIIKRTDDVQNLYVIVNTSFDKKSCKWYNAATDIISNKKILKGETINMEPLSFKVLSTNSKK